MRGTKVSEMRTRQRARVAELARDLARSGQHADHTTIIPQLEAVEGFVRERFEARAIRAQLDRLCAMARNPTTTRLNLAALRGRS